MDANLVTVLKQIIDERGDPVLSEPRRVSAYLADLARDVPKPQKNALIKCLEHGFAQTFKTVAEPERAVCKQKLAQRLHEEEGLDLGLCAETFDLLGVVLFGEEVKKNYCKNCGKELQEGWKACPYCSVSAGIGVKNNAVGSTAAIQPAIASIPGSEVIATKPVSPTPSNNTTVSASHKCVGCSFFNAKKMICSRLDLSAEAAEKIKCEFRPSPSGNRSVSLVGTSKCLDCFYLKTIAMECSYHNKAIADIGHCEFKVEGVIIPSPVPGKILRYAVNEGATVKAGDNVLIMEAMKMELEIKAPSAGFVHFFQSVGAEVWSKQPLAVIR